MSDSLVLSFMAGRTSASGWAGRGGLHLAVEHGVSDELMFALLAAGHDPNARDDRGKTPLHWAMFCNARPSLVALLLCAGADPSETDKYNRVPIEIGIKMRASSEIVDLLWRYV